MLYLGDHNKAPVVGHGCVSLCFSFGNSLLFKNVIHVPKIRQNLVSDGIINRRGYKQVYECNKYISSNCGAFIGFGY